MAKMLTLFGRELNELNYEQLERERRAQKHIMSAINRTLKEDLRMRKFCKNGVTQASQDKEDFANIYLAHLEAMIADVDYWEAHRIAPTNNKCYQTKKKRMAENEEKRRKMDTEKKNKKNFKKALDRDPVTLAWDREKFDLIAKDRGYQTEEYLLYKVGKELNLDRKRTVMLLNTGRFTWGQILCLGAMMEMTPKEFCDTFLANYFQNPYGEYRADYEHIQREELLKTAIRPTPQPVEEEKIEYEEVVVGSDGRPLDEEEWF